jgi:type IV pilus assembly protein PilA
MQKHGFTLIELLAVIVILSVIALIATPIIMNAIEESKKGASKVSAYSYIRTIEYSIATSISKKGYTIPETFLTSDDVNLSYSGTRPTFVDLQLIDGKVTGGVITINGHTITIGTSGQVIEITP